MHPLTKLGPRHHAAIRMKLGGASGRAIAAALGVERRTVYLWMGDPLVKRELGRQLARLNRRFTELEAAAALRSWSPSHSSARARQPDTEGPRVGVEGAAR